MKKIILILDGMADRGQKILGGMTPLEYADTPNLDRLFSKAEAGCVQTIPEGEEAGSAVANLNMLGYVSSEIYKGRAVIEAAGADITVSNDNLYIRTNFVTFQGESFDDSIIESYSAHDIDTKDARLLVAKLNDEVFEDSAKLINTDSFRNILVVKNKTEEYKKLLGFMPPHDIIGQPIKKFFEGNDVYSTYMNLLGKAYDVLKNNNDTRANGIWFWGSSVTPNTANAKTYDKKLILSETTLMRGISKLLNIEFVSTIESENFEIYLKEKLSLSLESLDGDHDLIYLHIQKPDDLSHELRPKEKAEALAMIDKIYVKGLAEKLENLKEDYSFVVASDHYTFSDTGGHGRQPAPFMLINSSLTRLTSDDNFTEKNCISRNNNITPKQLHEKMHI